MIQKRIVYKIKSKTPDAKILEKASPDEAFYGLTITELIPKRSSNNKIYIY